MSLATRSRSGSSWMRRREPGTSLPQVLLSPRRGCLGRELPRGEEQPLCPPFAQGALRQNSLGISHPGANPWHAHLVRLLTKPKLSLFKCKLRAHATSSAPQLRLARISLGEAAQEHPVLVREAPRQLREAQHPYSHAGIIHLAPPSSFPRPPPREWFADSTCLKLTAHPPLCGTLIKRPTGVTGSSSKRFCL